LLIVSLPLIARPVLLLAAAMPAVAGVLARPPRDVENPFRRRCDGLALPRGLPHPGNARGDFAVTQRACFANPAPAPIDHRGSRGRSITGMIHVRRQQRLFAALLAAAQRGRDTAAR
jgi:hypothetical protein